MHDKLKKLIEWINSILFLGGLTLALLYTASPLTRRWVEVNITNISAWYYLGSFNNETGRWNTKKINGRDVPNVNFYHVAWYRAYAGNPAYTSINRREMEDLPGKVLISDPQIISPGRIENKNVRGFSKNDIITNLGTNDCYYVNDIQDTSPENGNRDSYFWINATKISCD